MDRQIQAGYMKAKLDGQKQAGGWVDRDKMDRRKQIDGQKDRQRQTQSG